MDNKKNSNEKGCKKKKSIFLINAHTFKSPKLFKQIE